MRSTAINTLRQRLVDLYREPYFTREQCDEVNSLIDQLEEHQRLPSGRKIKVTGKMDGSKFKATDPTPKHFKIAKQAKAKRTETRLRANRESKR